MICITSKNKRITEGFCPFFLVFLSPLPFPLLSLKFSSPTTVANWDHGFGDSVNGLVGINGQALLISCLGPSQQEAIFTHFTPLCYGVRARSDSWCAAEGTKFTHFERGGKSIYLTCKLPTKASRFPEAWGPLNFAFYLEPFEQNHCFFLVLTTSPDLNFISDLRWHPTSFWLVIWRRFCAVQRKCLVR